MGYAALVVRASVEVCYMDPLWVNGERTVQLAVNDVLCVPFTVHKSTRERFRTEKAWLGYLTRQAVALIDLYGDARNPKPALFEGGI